ncbi:MAG TPA: phage tail sheath subtilisin-like domain-containing protein, partial [Gaiellaceae bacterium]
IAAMVSIWFHIWTHPYTDATTLTAIETELATRNGPMRQQQGLAITSASGSFSTLSTLGTGRNSPHSCIVAQSGHTPLTPPMEFAAETAALVAQYGAADPGRPFQTLAYSRAIATPETDQWDPSTERNLLLYAGIATTKRAAGGVVQIDRLITTYETSPSGASDTSYLDATTLLTLMYLRYSFKVRIQTKYPRHKLGDDGVRVGSGQAVITPKLGKVEAVAWFEDMLELGLVEDLAQFKRDLLCARSSTDPNRLEWLLPPNLINQFIVGAAQIQFLL